MFPSLQLALCLGRFSLSETCQARPFTKAQAHYSYCFKKNFLALRLKLKVPFESFLFCLFLPLLVAAPPFPPSSWAAGSGGLGTEGGSISVGSAPPSPQGAGQVCPPAAQGPPCPSKGQVPSTQMVSLTLPVAPSRARWTAGTGGAGSSSIF